MKDNNLKRALAHGITETESRPTRCWVMVWDCLKLYIGVSGGGGGVSLELLMKTEIIPPF